MSTLTADDFATFLNEVHGRAPYPWQERLVRHVLDHAAWPDVLDVPTGLGKTTVIDISVFIAAACPQAARRRTFFVVDRRLVVDEAHDHAQALAQALGDPRGPITTAVAAALRAGEDGGPPLQVTRMRGGATWSWRWLDRPDRHAVIVGTIDQIGSRLLFRGYGVGEFLRPIDAALTGTDSLIVLDEAHLAEPFRTTMKAALELGPTPISRRPVVLTMSATSPPGPDDIVLRTNSDDLLHEHAGPLLRAPRTLTLLKAPVTRKNAHSALPRLLADWATELAGDAHSGQAVLVVCNTVARARAVHTRLAHDLADGQADTVLLTGRSRPIDREYLLHRWYPQIRAGRHRQPGTPLIVCATQTVEVGANIDADALITESASLAALIQRLGRLNRRALLPHAPALVIHDPTAGPDDPVYGTTRQTTWDWLTELAPMLPPRTAPGASALDAGLDVSPAALARLMRSLDPSRQASMRQAPPYTPVLFTSTLDAWARTSPIPHPDTPVAPYLHGLAHGAPDVTVVWRSDLPDYQPDSWAAIVEPVRPSLDEAVQVPLPAVRRWLTGLDEAAVSDIEGQADNGEPDDEPNGGPGGRVSSSWQRVLRIRGTSELINVAAIRPGDLIVVPATWGGCDEHGWNPSSTAMVRDLGDLPSRRGRPVVRVREELVVFARGHHPWAAGVLADLTAQARQDTGGEDRPSAAHYRAVLSELLKACPTQEQDLPLVRNLGLLAGGCRASITGSTLLLARRGGGWTGDIDPLGSSALTLRTPIGLAEHQAAVAARAAQFATNLGLDAELVESVRAAARWHDEGKRDPRFQAMLRGRPFRTSARLRDADLLAKSSLNASDRMAFRRARLLARYPDGMRHEALSAQLAQLYLRSPRPSPGRQHCSLPARDGLDSELVIHLVASHHGRSRPLLPPITDPAPQTVTVHEGKADTGLTVDWDGPDRFADLNARYGPWGLALLETIVRLADIWCSEHDEAEAPEETP